MGWEFTKKFLKGYDSPDYRCKIGSSIWHWRRECKEWPILQYSTTDLNPPPFGELCEECKEKEQVAKKTVFSMMWKKNTWSC